MIELKDINLFLYDAQVIAKADHYHYRYESGTGPEQLVTAEFIKKGDKSEAVPLYQMLYASLVAIHVRLGNLADRTTNKNYLRLIIRKWKEWNLEPIPLTGIVGINQLDVQLYLTLAVPYNETEEFLNNIMSYVENNTKKRLRSDAMPTGYTLSVTESMASLASIMAQQILGIGQFVAVTEVESETSSGITEIRPQGGDIPVQP